MAWTTATERVLQFDAEVFEQTIGTERSCHLGDHEFYIVLTITARDVSDTLAALDVSGAGTMTLVMQSPTSSVSRFTLGDRTDGTDGLEQYLIADGDIDEEGPWTLYGELAFGTGIVSTQRGILHVEGPNYKGPERQPVDTVTYRLLNR